MVTEVSWEVGLSGDWEQLGDSTADVRESDVDDVNGVK